MWSIVSSMKLLRKPSKRGEGDIERKGGSKEASITHLDSDAQVNLDPSCSTDSGLSLNGNVAAKSATLGTTGISTSSSSKVKVERRESARLASSATKFLRSLRNHSGNSGKLVTSSVIAADDKHPINVIALKELDIDTHSLNPSAASSGGGGGGGSGSGSAPPSTSSSKKLPERSQSFNEKRLLVVTQNTSSENGAAGGAVGSSGQVKVKHSRAQSFVCNNSSRTKAGYSIYLNHHHQFQSTQQNQVNLAKQQLLLDHKSKSGSNTNGGNNADSSRSGTLQSQTASKVESTSGKTLNTADQSASTCVASRLNPQSCETIYENLEVILEEKQNQELNSKKSNASRLKDSIPKGSNPAHVPATKNCLSGDNTQQKCDGDGRNSSSDGCTESGNSSVTATGPYSSSESLNVNMKISGKDRPNQIRKYNKDSGYETSNSDYSNLPLPKSSSVDSIVRARMTVDKQNQGNGGGGKGGAEMRSNNRIMNTSFYEDVNSSHVGEEAQNNTFKQHGAPSTPGSRKLRRSISEVPSDRNTNLAKLQTKVGDSTARAMYTIANGLTVWTSEKSSSSLGLNSGSNQALHQYQNIYGCLPHSQLLHPQSSAPIPGGFSAAVHQASVYSTLPRNHTTNSGGSSANDAFGGIYRGLQYHRTKASSSGQQQSVNSQHSSGALQSSYQHYQQITAKSTPSLRNAVLHEHQQQKKSFGEPSATEDKQLSSLSSSSTTTTTHAVGSEPQHQQHQQQPIYQTIPIPTLSPARSTPNLGSAGVSKLLQPRTIQHHPNQGSIPQLSLVSSSQQQVNDLGKAYPSQQQHQHQQQLHQKIYSNHFGSSSSLGQQQQSLSASAVHLQQASANPHDKIFDEPSRCPSTPNLQKSESSQVLSASNSNFPQESHCNLPRESHSSCGDSRSTNSSNSSASNNNNLNSQTIVGAMSGNNDSSNSSSCMGGSWNALDSQNILNNNNNAPIRDPSSLKQIRYGPGHEKYPSWPIPVSSAQQIDPAGETHPSKLMLGSGSTRSKSWTEQTDYPKEKSPSYARPYMKRVNHSYTQQLKTVMEKCERIPPEAFTSRNDPQQIFNSNVVSSHPAGSRHNSHHSSHQLPHHHGGVPKSNEGGGGIVPPPLLYRDLMCNQQNGHGNAASMERGGYNHHHNHHHNNNMIQYYQSQASGHPQQPPGSTGGNTVAPGEKEYMIPSPPEKECTVSKPLTQEDLELYTKKYEELITQYPQSEGYHSYISSDSSSYISSGTPFLDQLRRESENNQQFWSGDKCGTGGIIGHAMVDPNDPLFGLMGGQLASAVVSGRESVTTVVTNSSSNSSGTETLKWHGSTSDISLASGVGGGGGGTILSNSLKSNSQNNSHPNSARKSMNMLSKAWNEQQQNIAHSARLSTPQKQHAAAPSDVGLTSQQNAIINLRNKLEHLNGSPSALNKWPSDNLEHANNNINSNGSGNNNGNNNNNGAPNLKKFPLNTYTRPNTLSVDKTNSSQGSSGNSSATSTPEKMAKLLQSLNAEAASSMSNLKGAKSLSHSLSSPVIDTSKPPSVAERILELEQQSSQQSSTASPSTSGTSSPKMSQHHAHGGQSESNNHAFLASSFMKSSSLNNIPTSQGALYVDESCSNNFSQQQQQNEWSQGNTTSAMSPRGGFSQSTTVNKMSSENNNVSNGNMSYGYLDPDKKHKVADMTLKAIQKKALLSYYERHKGKCPNTSSASSISSSEGGNPNQAEGLPMAEKDICFSGKQNRLMLSLPKEHNVDQQSNVEHGSESGKGSSIYSATMSSPSSSNRGYRAISVSSGVSTASSSSSRSSSGSNSKASSQSQLHHQLVHGANNNTSNISPKTFQYSATTSSSSGSPTDDLTKQMEKSTAPNSSTSDNESPDMFHGSESARLAYMSKYLPHLVNREATPSGTVWPSNGGSNSSSAKLPPAGTVSSNGSAFAAAAVTQEPAPIPPERPPKKPHLRNLAQQAHEESKDSKPPPPLPRAPVRPPALMNNGSAAQSKLGNSGPPPIPSKPVVPPSSTGIGMTRSPSPDELPPPPPPPQCEEMEVLVNDDPLPPPPTVTEVDVLFGSRTRSVTGLSSCLHKDSYMAQRKERTLGYEGRYRRTLSPSGLGSNNNKSKSTLETASSPGVSDPAGARTTAPNLSTEKLDTTLSPAAWEKFHNIRAPSTTVIFTSNELAKGSGSSPTSSSTPSTSSSPQPPMLQPLFHRSISCDSNIFNNKTGASQSSIPPPVAQVAPLRGSSSITNGGQNSVDNSIEKISQLSLRNDVISSPPPSVPSPSKSCDNNSNSSSPQLQHDNTTTSNGALNNTDGSKCDKEEKCYRDTVSQKNEFNEHTEQQTGSGRILSNSTLPSVIVPPLQYEKESSRGSSGFSLSSSHSSPDNNISNHNSFLKKSEVNLRVNCNSDITLQIKEDQNGFGSGCTTQSSSPSDAVVGMNSEVYSGSKAQNNSNNNHSSSLTTAAPSNSTASFYTGRQKTQEELECEELSRDIAKLLPQGDKLQTLLVPLPDHKTTADYMEGLFHLELKLQPDAMERRGSQTLSVCLTDTLSNPEKSRPISNGCGDDTSSQNQKTVSVEEGDTQKSGGLQSNLEHPDMSHSPDSRQTPKLLPASDSVAHVNNKTASPDEKSQHNHNLSASYRRCNGHAPLPADSAYFTTSESKAKFLTQYNNDIKKEPISKTTDGEELDKQKEQLVSRISRKLEILRTEQQFLREEIQSNEQLGQMVVERVKQTAKRNEFDKFKLHVEEIEKITSLLLGISGRLARAENALMGLSDPPNPQEKKILESKRDKLREQLDEAKILKENIDRRSAQVSSFLQKYLTAEEYADYDHFVKMKAKLIIDAREIDDKIKLGEEQLGALKDALNTSIPLSPNVSAS